MNIEKIKLVIWDLDDTFWQGTLSEGDVLVDPKNITLVNNMLDAGVVCSICSKNDEQRTNEYLADIGLQELFVFTSINWSSKGERVAQIVKEMNLRDANVLFIDDNIGNREEVQHRCPNMMVEDVDCLPQLYRYFETAHKKDTARKRLAQYRVLETKNAFRAAYGSNESFLRSCNIRVTFCRDCMAEFERIHELILRTNQLNFTKQRWTEAQLAEILQDESVQASYITVTDTYGDYGIVGFYAVRENSLLQFCFSCRTLNMGVEQYVYYHLGCPKLEIIGEVASDLSSGIPDWINVSTDASSADKQNMDAGKILIKGPCDMQQIFTFIKEGKNILTEFVYVNDMGVSVESAQHSWHIVQSQTVPQEELDQVIRELPFGDKDMYRTRLFDKDMDVVVYSLFTDPNLGIYEYKHSHVKVAFGEYTNDLTDETLWPQFIAGELFVANCQFTKKQLAYIRDNYRFLGRITPDEILANLTYIRERMNPAATLILCLGSEIPFDGNTSKAYADRHLYHRELNGKVRKWAAAAENVEVVDINEMIHGQDAFTNNINHFTRAVYYQISQKVAAICSARGSQLRNKTDRELKMAKYLSPLKKLTKIPQKIRILINRMRCHD